MMHAQPSAKDFRLKFEHFSCRFQLFLIGMKKRFCNFISLFSQDRRWEVPFIHRDTKCVTVTITHSITLPPALLVYNRNVVCRIRAIMTAASQITTIFQFYSSPITGHPLSRIQCKVATTSRRQASKLLLCQVCFENST